MRHARFFLDAVEQASKCIWDIDSIAPYADAECEVSVETVADLYAATSGPGADSVVLQLSRHSLRLFFQL